MGEKQKTKYLVIGNSHTVALQQVISNNEFIIVNLQSIFKENGNKRVPANLMNEYDPDYVFSMMGGMEYNLLTLLEGNIPYDFAVPGDNEADLSRAAIPYHLFRDALLQRMTWAIDGISDLARMFQGRVRHIAPPPPVLDLTDADKIPSLLISTSVSGPAPASLRMKSYNLYVLLLNEACVPLGVPVVLPPPETCSPDGFLLRTYWDRDPTHGNSLYGEAILRQIQEVLRG